MMVMHVGDIAVVDGVECVLLCNGVGWYCVGSILWDIVWVV